MHVNWELASTLLGKLVRCDIVVTEALGISFYPSW